MNRTEYEVEKGIEIPEHVPFHVTAKRKYPFLKMEIGDSFLVPETKGIKANSGKKISECTPKERRDKRARHRVSSAIEIFKRWHRDFDFTVRITDEGLRVWRIEKRQPTIIPTAETTTGETIKAEKSQ